MRVFLDTNVLVSAFASRGLCADVFEIVLLEHDLVVGKNVLRELQKALRRKIKLPAADAAEVVEFLQSEAIAVIAEVAHVNAKIDPADALVLGDAVAGSADVFVTGDAALLRLGATASLEVSSPRGFWEMLRAEGASE